MTASSPNSRSRLVIRVAAAVLSLGACRFAFAQPAPTSSAAGQEIVELPKFVITETRTNPYQSAQALSTSRIAVGIQDIPQTVSVVTSDFIQDTQGNRMLDVAKYVTPIV